MPSFVSAAEEAALAGEVLSARGGWLDKSHLRFSNTRQQEYGACISDAMEVVDGGSAPPLPPAFRRLAARVAAEAARLGLGGAADFATEGQGFLRVNHYRAEGGGYMHKHMDSQKCFGPVIACCSLLADTGMTFYDTKGNSFGMARVHRTAEVAIPRRSLYFMSGPARFQWQHGIRKDQCPRERISLTFRTVREDAPRAGAARAAERRRRASPKEAPGRQAVLKRPAGAPASGRPKGPRR